MPIHSAVAAALLLAASVNGGPAPAATHNTFPCNQACRSQWQLQEQNALPRSGFYDAPAPLPWAPAGTLIRRQQSNDYQVDNDPVTATRILYHSRTSSGRDVAASGVLLVPTGPPPNGGWPVVADAHGTSGFGINCAPSLMRDLYHGEQMLQFVRRGWAVVAPDYAGLGTTGRDEFVNKTAEANDVIDAVQAVHQARSDLSSRWVLWGHSQGGGAALAVAERQVGHPLPGYLGTVVTSPAADLPTVMASVVDQPGLGGFVPLIAAGAKVSDPALRLDAVLARSALQRLSVVATGCLGVVAAVYADLSHNTLVRPGYQAEPHLAAYLRENSTGDRPVAGPVLLLQGDADTVIPATITDRVAESLCRLGANLDYRTYRGLAHDTYPGMVIGIDDGAMPDILAWTADRFAGQPVPSNCSTGARRPVSPMASGEPK